jgi:hypothetical protein
MKKYVVTSSGFQGELMFKYDLNGDIIGFEIQAVLTKEQKDWYFKNLPKTESDLVVEWPRKSKTIKVVEVPEDLSFEAFWTRYGYKVGDKKKATKLWNEMKPESRALALSKIERYKKFAENANIALVYPERYLSQRRFENEF